MSATLYTYCTACLSCVLTAASPDRPHTALDNPWLECAGCRSVEPLEHYRHLAPVTAHIALSDVRGRKWAARQLELAATTYRAPAIGEQLADALHRAGYFRR